MSVAAQDRNQLDTHPRLLLFGPPRIELGGRGADLALRKGQALLAYLAVTGRAHSRDALATLLWPDSDQQSGRASLRRTLHRVNQVLGPDMLDVTPETVAVSGKRELWLDVTAFEEAATAGLTQGQAAHATLTELKRAADLYVDDFLAGFSLADCPDFDEWQFFRADALRRRLVEVLERLVELLGDRREPIEAIPYARRRVNLDPTDEAAQRDLMRLYALSGHKSAALRQYERCTKVLERELGLQPAPETLETVEAIRGGNLAQTQATSDDLPETRYVLSGDLHIAYQVVGSGPVDLLFVPGFVSHLEQSWEEPALAGFFRQLAGWARLILFDKRGMGLSDRVGAPPTLADTAGDMLTVMNAVGSRRAVVFGASEGGPACVAFTARYPERVAGLIMYGSMAKGTRTRDYRWALTSAQYDAWLAQLIASWGEAQALEFFAPSNATDPQLAKWWARTLRLASSPSACKAVLEVLRDIDVRELLPQIDTPTLILHRKDDRAILVQAGRYMAEHIPNAQLVELPGRDHWWWIGNYQPLLRQIEGFMDQITGTADR
jgi:DNA-binding SARP family transcriptional activator/pimeloyl-ACP methyl ester carboxylesterase